MSTDMADSQAPPPPPKAKEDDSFERDLQEMLDDGPSLNDVGSTVQGGTPNTMSATYSGSYGATTEDMPSPATQGRLTRSFTVPPGVLPLCF